MINSNRIIVVLPAYNAARTLAKTVAEIDRDIVDEIILVDDFSADNTAEIAQALSLKTVRHQENKGYGANQKTCFELALSEGADIIIMVHPDYQYSPRLIPAMAFMILSQEYDVVLGTRMLGRGALSGGMPLYKFVANRMLTSIENLVFRRSFSEKTVITSYFDLIFFLKIFNFFSNSFFLIKSDLLKKIISLFLPKLSLYFKISFLIFK